MQLSDIAGRMFYFNWVSVKFIVQNSSSCASSAKEALRNCAVHAKRHSVVLQLSSNTFILGVRYAYGHFQNSRRKPI